mgnify:FL=1
MTIKVAINGFGRIGRMALRACLTHFPNIQIVGINDLLTPEYLAYLFKYDSVHGKFNEEVILEADHLLIKNHRIRITSERNPEYLNWKALDVDIVIESTGIFLTEETCSKHITAGAKKVVQSAPPKDNTPIFVYGVNHETYRGERIISAASCTTNALAPIAKVLNDAFGIKRGLMTTVHATTASQNTVDAPSSKDWRGGRGILENIIPSSTGAAKAVGKVIPSLQNKITGMALRIPSSDVSVIDLTCELERSAPYEIIVGLMKVASETAPLKGVLGFTQDKVVSTDFRGETCASVFDSEAGIAIDDKFLKIVAWYDNEYGYTCNMLRLIEHLERA